MQWDRKIACNVCSYIKWLLTFTGKMSGEYVYACACCVAWKINETFKIIKLKVFVTLGSGELSKQNRE